MQYETVVKVGGRFFSQGMVLVCRDRGNIIDRITF